MYRDRTSSRNLGGVGKEPSAVSSEGGRNDLYTYQQPSTTYFNSSEIPATGSNIPI